MFKTLLRLLAVVGTLDILTAQFVFEYDYYLQNPEPRLITYRNYYIPNPEPRLNVNPDHYTRYRNLHFTRKQCPEIELLVGKNIRQCIKKCDANVKCTAINYITGTGHNGLKCSMRACGSKPPYPIGVGKKEDRWDGYSKKKIEKGYTRYNGPHKGYYLETQGCRNIHQGGTNKSYVECMDFCSRYTRCTGINFDINTFDCQSFNCGDPTTPPLGDDLPWLESWTKQEIKAKELTSYTRYEDYHYSDRQCTNLHASKGGYGLNYCKSRCDKISQCTAFNLKEYFLHKNGIWYKDTERAICVLRDCGLNPPYPIGKATDDDWHGYSVNKIAYGYAKYFGPYGRHWSTKKKCSNIINGEKTVQKVDCKEPCRNMGPTRKSKTSTICEKLCDDNTACSGFNFNIKSYDCQLVACTSRTTQPTEEYTEWEGWSKEKITDHRGLPPNPKCPSFSCTINAVVDNAFDKRCSACMCQADPWCFYKCGAKCEHLDHNYLTHI